jgi:hypothetical protein
MCLAGMLASALLVNLVLPNNNRQLAEKSRIAAKQYCEITQSYTRQVNEVCKGRSRLPAPECP